MVPTDILAAAGFAILPGAATRLWLEGEGSLDDWPAFVASWEGMPQDTYMADGGRYRRRRFAVFTVDPAGDIRRSPHQPHYQTTDYNPLNGGVERWFEPVPETITTGPSFRAILAACRTSFTSLAPGAAWHIETHQFRIEAGPAAAGKPTPEGMHRDGVDYVLVLMVRRENIERGTTSIHGLDGTELGSFTLTAPLDAALVDDRRVFHGVTPVRPVDPVRPAFRDVLVVTFRRSDAGQRLQAGDG